LFNKDKKFNIKQFVKKNNEQTLRTFNINVNNLLSSYGIKIIQKSKNKQRNKYGYSIGFKKNIDTILLKNKII